MLSLLPPTQIGNTSTTTLFITLLLVDIQAKLAEGKGVGFARWAKQHNLKEMSRTLVFLQENKIGSIEEMQERVDAATAHYHELGDFIKTSEKRLAEIAVLKAHIINYAKTRPVYDAYRKTGYSKRFLETHSPRSRSWTRNIPSC